MEVQKELGESNDQAPAQKEETIEQLEQENKRMEEVINKKKELQRELDELRARDRISGKAEAGKPMKTDEDLKKEKDDVLVDRLYSSVYDLKKRRR